MRHRTPTKIRALATTLIAAVALTGCGKNATSPQPVDHTLAGVLGRTLARHHLPAIAGAVVHGDSIAEIACLGVRKLGAPDSVTLDDHFHLGSNVKAMTADLIAMEVEAGRLAWGRTLAEVFPEFVDSMRAEYQGVTIEAVLQHRAGLPALTESAEFVSVPEFQGTLAERRQASVRWLLQQAPPVAPGEYLYSNGGYALAGAILERTAAASWESLITARLWTPLGIAGGFDWPATGGAPQPWGHHDVGGGLLAPHDPNDPDEQFPDLLRAAGEAHMSIGDYAKFALLHLRGLRGHAELLAAATFQRLHTPNGPYALGWGVQSVDGVATSFHAGSAGTFAAGVMIQPDRDVAVVILANAGSADAIRAVQEAAIELLRR